MELESGTTLQNGKYKILKTLGQGGFGITYLAEQTGLGMRVAIKEFFLKGSCQRDNVTSRVSVPIKDNEELTQRCLKKFKSEARKIASLNNDHIINIIDIFDENGTSYYVMKYLAGGSLAAEQEKGAMSEKAALKVIREISEALDSVHAHGLLHLDIKPANILFDDRGRAVLIDFGVSKYADSQQDSSTTSSLIGFSRGYAPLEQVNSTVSALSPATDIYALGATLYALVTGTVPPEASVVMNAGLPELPASLSQEVKNAITQSMQPRRKDRPQDVNAFRAHLPKVVVPQPKPKPAPSDETVVVRSGAAKAIPSQPQPSRRSGRIPIIISSILFAGALGLSIYSFTTKGEVKVEEKTVVETVVDREEVNKLNNKVTTLTQQNNDLQGQVNTLKQKNSSLQSEVSSLKKQVDEYKPDAERWRRQMNLNR